MARLYYKVKLECLLAWRGVVKCVKRFDDSPYIQNCYNKLTADGVVTSWKLSLIQDDSNQQDVQNDGTEQRIKLDEETYLGVKKGMFACVQDGDDSTIWNFLECPTDNSTLVYCNNGSYYWNWTQGTGTQGYQLGLLPADQLTNQTIRNYPSDPGFKFCFKPLPDSSQYSYITLYDQQHQYIKLNKSSEQVLQVEYRDSPPTDTDCDFLFYVESIPNNNN